MKKQKRNKVDFIKNSISELNNFQLLQVKGGTHPTLLFGSSIGCAVIEASSAVCEDYIFNNDFE